MTDSTLAPLIVEQSPDAIIFAGGDGLIREWNAAAEAIFGYSNAEATGQSLDIIIPEEFRASHWAAYDKALAAGDTKYRGRSMPTRATKKDGTTIYVELSFAIVHSQDGSVIGALAHARDITERWSRDREQRRRLRELEEKLGQSGQA